MSQGQVLQKYLPERAVDDICQLLEMNRVYLKIVNERVTKHGDYRKLASGQHVITINASLNKYQFLITLVHEVAHLVAFEKYGRRIKPHGIEWKMTFQRLMLPFLNPTIFPSSLLPVLAQHFKNPRASSDTDVKLALSLRQYDEQNDKSYIFEIPLGSTFRIHNGKVFQKGKRRIKRYECVEVTSGRVYLFQPNAEVELIRT